MFFCNIYRKCYFVIEIGIKGLWVLIVLDIMIGERRFVVVFCRLNGWIWFDWYFEVCGSVLLELLLYIGEFVNLGIF